MRARTWPATLRPQKKGYWDASDRARERIARHAAEVGPMWPMEAETLSRIGRLFADFKDGLAQLDQVCVCTHPAAVHNDNGLCIALPGVLGCGCLGFQEAEQ